MENLSWFALFFGLLLVSSGCERCLAATPGCERTQALYGGGCVQAKCNGDCVAKYGANAYGLCFFYQKPDDTCVCRSPC